MVYSQSTIQELVFIGLHETGSPALCRTFDKQLRYQLESVSGISLTASERTRYYSDLIRFSRNSTVDKERVALLEKSVTDSLLLLWMHDITTEIQPVRKHFWGCVLNGKCTVRLTLYDIASKVYLFNGVITTEVQLPTSPIFFSSPEKVVHISSSERTIINESLINKAVDKSVSIIKSLIRNNTSHKTLVRIPEQKVDNTPSISDVFSIPSVEPLKIGNIEENDTVKKNTLPLQAPGKPELRKDTLTIKTK
jgi:hypothetical protein